MVKLIGMGCYVNRDGWISCRGERVAKLQRYEWLSCRGIVAKLRGMGG